MNNTKDKISVLFILPALSAGGAERVMITYMNHLNTDKFVPSFLSITNKGTLGNLINPNIKQDSLKCSRSATSILRLYTYIIKHKPDIVITTMAYINFILLLLKPFIKNTKFIVREANRPTAVLQHNKHLGFVFKYLYKYLYPIADRVIVPADCLTLELKDELNVNTDNNITIYNPVDKKILGTLEHSNKEKDSNEIKLIASGRLHTQRGLIA